jgi:hypothetical protein
MVKNINKDTSNTPVEMLQWYSVHLQNSNIYALINTKNKMKTTSLHASTPVFSTQQHKDCTLAGHDGEDIHTLYLIQML